MSMEKQLTLVQRLLSKTKAGNLDWKESGLQGAFQVSFRNNSILINRAGSHDEDIMVSLVNENGDVVETFKDNDIRGEYSDADARLMFDLYEMARRTALGSEKVLNSILKELDDDIPF
jgi:flagellar hook protein FlgE